MQMLRQDGVFHRPEQSRVAAHQKQSKKQDVEAMQPETETGDQHDDDFEDFDQPRQRGFVVFIRQLPGRG